MKLTYYIGRSLCAVFLKLFFHLKVEGAENIPARGGFLLAGNHVSYLDPVVFGVSAKRDLHFMARDTLFKGIARNLFFRSINAFPLKRNSADIGAIKEALRLLKKGEGVLVFPEGTRRVGGELGKPRAGVGFLMRMAKVPVVPAFAWGTDQAMPKGSKGFKAARITVVFGRPFDIPSGKDIPDEDASRMIMDRIRQIKESRAVDPVK